MTLLTDSQDGEDCWGKAGEYEQTTCWIDISDLWSHNYVANFLRFERKLEGEQFFSHLSKIENNLISWTFLTTCKQKASAL